MTNEQKQQIKARFFGMHLGCNVRCSTVVGDGIYTNEGIYSVGDGNYVISTDVGTFKLQDNCQLILRPLSSITDDEAIIFGQLVHPDWSEKMCLDFGLRCLKGRSGRVPMSIECGDYLRSKSFAIPFQGLDPIAENWAVLETETPQP